MNLNIFRKYAQTRADTNKKVQRHTKYVQMRADTRKYTQMHANTRKYDQVHAYTANPRRYMQIRPNTRRYTQMLYNRRKDTASSHEQLQGAPFSSVRRHVPASLIMITRFPFTYQTGF